MTALKAAWASIATLVVCCTAASAETLTEAHKDDLDCLAVVSAVNAFRDALSLQEDGVPPQQAADAVQTPVQDISEMLAADHPAGPNAARYFSERYFEAILTHQDVASHRDEEAAQALWTDIVNCAKEPSP